MIKSPRVNSRFHLISEALTKYPQASLRTLARILHGEFPQEFPSIEIARSALRYRAGQQGDSSGSTPKLKRKSGKAGTKTLAIPPGQTQSRAALKFPKPGSWLLISDFHVPYHNEKALEAAIKHAVDQKIQNVAIDGDAIDFYKLSTWSQDPRYRDPHEELKILNEVLLYIAHHFKGLKVYKSGNHEERYERYLFQRAPAMVGIEDFELPKILKLKDMDWQWVHGRQRFELGNLSVLHGHELPRGLTDPVNIGRGVWLRVRESAIVGHWHRTSMHMENAGIHKKLFTCYSLGCLCDLSPEYATINSWNHGFAIVRVGDKKTWNVSNRTIYDGQVYATE